MKKSLLAVVAAAALVFPLSGCSLWQTSVLPLPGSSKNAESTHRWDLESVQEAVIAADPSIAGMLSVKPTQSGFSRGLEMVFIVEDDTPVSPDVLRQVIAAAWEATSHELDMVALIAAVGGAESTQTADLQEAATQLVGEGSWSASGQGGVIIMSTTIEKLLSAE